jgi:uncharacterized protein (TIGR03435 family)
VISLYTFALLLHEALGVQRFQLVGAPAWIDSERFLIEAKPPASSKLSSFTRRIARHRWSRNSGRCCSRY